VRVPVVPVVVVVVDAELETRPGLDEDPVVVVVDLPVLAPDDEPEGVATTLVPRLSVWNPSTAASPAAVPARTIGVRLIS
jgi:hypothetical protein